MNDDVKRIQIRWRRRLFSFHLLLMLIIRLAVGSLNEMPPAPIYDWFGLWGMVIYAHGILLAILDGRDHADPPLLSLERVIEPRERRWTLFVIDALLWVMFTMMIANRVIPLQTIEQYVVPLSMVWLAHTAVGLAHTLLMIYAEVRDRTLDKPKRPALRNLLETGDGELIDFDDFYAHDSARKDSARKDAL